MLGAKVCTSSSDLAVVERLGVMGVAVSIIWLAILC